jgi:hypothetical protein
MANLGFRAGSLTKSNGWSYRKIYFQHQTSIRSYTMPVNNSLDHLRAKPLAEFHDPLLVAGWTQMPPFA